MDRTSYTGHTLRLDTAYFSHAILIPEVRRGDNPTVQFYIPHSQTPLFLFYYMNYTANNLVREPPKRKKMLKKSPKTEFLSHFSYILCTCARRGVRNQISVLYIRCMTLSILFCIKSISCLADSEAFSSESRATTIRSWSSIEGRGILYSLIIF